MTKFPAVKVTQKIVDMVNTQKLSIVSWIKSNPLELKYNFGQIFDLLHNATPLVKPNYFPIEYNPREVTLTEYTVGRQWAYDTSEVNDVLTWINHKLNATANRREGMFHYQQALEL